MALIPVFRTQRQGDLYELKARKIGLWFIGPQQFIEVFKDSTKLTTGGQY